jgi:hypothetical protein
MFSLQPPRHIPTLPFWIEPPAASSPVMPAVAPIAAEFCAPQRMAVSANNGREQMQQSEAKNHSIRLAVTSSVIGIVMPSALAVFMLMTNSYFVGACTGRSVGFAPSRMRSA